MVRAVLSNNDLTNVFDVENLYRSVAMLAPGARALDRDEALKLLATLRDLLEVQDSK